MPFGLDFKSVVIGGVLGMLVVPRVLSFASSKLGGSK